MPKDDGTVSKFQKRKLPLALSFLPKGRRYLLEKPRRQDMTTSGTQFKRSKRGGTWFYPDLRRY